MISTTGFQNDAPRKVTYQEPTGPVLDGVPLSELEVEQVDTPVTGNIADTAGVTFTPDKPRPWVAHESTDAAKTAV